MRHDLEPARSRSLLRATPRQMCAVALATTAFLMTSGVAGAAPKPKPTPSPTPTTAAGAVTIKAPYAGDAFNRKCDRAASFELQEACDSEIGLDKSVGDTEVFDSVASPRYGQAPQINANEAWSFATVSASTNLQSATASLPVYVTFHVSDARAEMSDQSVDLPPSEEQTGAAGGLFVDVPGHGSAARATTLVDSDPTTSDPATAAGDFLVSTQLTNVAAGPLEISAGVGGAAGVGEHDIARTTVSIEAVVTAVQIGGSAPALPGQGPARAPKAVYQAPYAAAYAHDGRTDIRSKTMVEVPGASTADEATGRATFAFDTVGSPNGGRGMQAGTVRFDVTHTVASASTVTVTAVWDIDSVRSVHASPQYLYGDFADASATLELLRPNGDYLGEGSWSEVPVFHDHGNLTNETNRTVTVTVTVPNVSGDILVRTGLEAYLGADLGASKFDLDAHLRSVTIY